jgi:hypothetical protein
MGEFLSTKILEDCMVTIRFVATSLLIYLLISITAFAQNSVKEKYSKAEESFDSKDYTTAITLCDEIISSSGKQDPKVLHLQIKALYNRFFIDFSTLLTGKQDSFEW